MLGKFDPKKFVDQLPAKDRQLIGHVCDWTIIGTVPKGNKDYAGQAMMAPEGNVGFTFGWTPEEDVDLHVQ